MMTKSQFEDQLASMMGGRAAEMLIFKEITTGAANDLNQATTLARQMVTQYGMSSKLGPRTFGKVNELVFLGRDIAETRDYSESIAEQIDDEVSNLVTRAHQRATDVLNANEEMLRRLADHLTEVETMGVEEFVAVFEGREIPVQEEQVEEPESAADESAPAPESPSATPRGPHGGRVRQRRVGRRSGVSIGDCDWVPSERRKQSDACQGIQNGRKRELSLG